MDEMSFEIDESLIIEGEEEEEEDDNDDDTEMENVQEEEEEEASTLDCYPYTFTPLLLFCQSSYFDKGYSNYNSVAQFFERILPVNMLDNVLYERKNMLYEELFDYVTSHQMLVTCCIDAHFTAFQVIQEKKGKPALLYYDPTSANLQRVSGDGYRTLCLYLLMKCNYGDSQHIQENRDHYTGISANNVRRAIYTLWRKINQINNIRYLTGVNLKSAPLNVQQFMLINDSRNPRLLSTQQTSNTCYFQTFLYAVLCKISTPTLNNDGTSVDLHNLELLKETTLRMCRYLLEFFVEKDYSSSSLPLPLPTTTTATTTTTKTNTTNIIMRPLTNSNLVLDFYRFESSPYYSIVTNYLQRYGSKSDDDDVPLYEVQYNTIMEYYWGTKILHKYGKFVVEGAVASSPNTKSLQSVNATEDAVRKLARADYYKYRAANFMFGFNAGIVSGMESFSEFNSFRKNQLLRFYPRIKDYVGDCTRAVISGNKKLTNKSGHNKYRDYCTLEENAFCHIAFFHFCFFF